MINVMKKKSLKNNTQPWSYRRFSFNVLLDNVSFLEKMESENYYHPLHDNKGTLY
jgi:recombinational DNA repair protein (RecF pathway)